MLMEIVTEDIEVRKKCGSVLIDDDADFWQFF